MRLNRVSELIHNSTDCQNMDCAGVSVHFQEIIDSVNTNILLLLFLIGILRKENKNELSAFTEDKFEDFWLQLLQDDGTFEAVPGSDFVITRVAYRDNSSKYYINDRSSN